MSFFYDILSKPTPITSGFHSLCHLVSDLHRPLKSCLGPATSSTIYEAI